MTATAPQTVQKDIIARLSLQNVKKFQVSCFRSNLYYDIEFKNLLQDDFIELKAYIESRLKQENGEKLKDDEKPCGIIYCRKKETTESVARGLRRLGMNCSAFHSDLKKSEKMQVQDDWMSGKCPVIAATVSFGMGIDKASVRVVIHWDVPQSISGWYQESGRAGRDGKNSYCRVYYDREEVRSMSFLLNQAVSQMKSQQNKEREKIAKDAVEEYVKISDHCEGTICRHLLFTNFFRDEPPNCQDRCDVCKDKKKVLRKIEEFQMIGNQKAFNKYNKIPDQDFEDLYEGGKVSANLKFKGSFADYDYETNSDGSGGEHSGFRTASSLVKKQDRDFIQKQFDLRKAQAAEKMEDFPKTQISRVKQPMSTETKVKGLTIKGREVNLDSLIATLKSHKEKMNQKTDHNLSRVDFEDVAKEMEYKIFSQCQAVSVYRNRIMKLIHSLKTATELCEELKSHVPKSRQSFGGDYKTIVDDLKTRYGADVVNELENEKKKKVERKRKDKFQQSGRDGLKQEKINSFFVKNETKSDTQLKSRESSVEIIEVKQEIIEVFDDVPESKPMEVEPDEDFHEKCSLDEKILQLENLGKTENNKNSPFFPEVPEVKEVKEIKVEENSRKRKIEENHEESPKRIRENSQKSSEKLSKKTEISSVVVKELMSFYRKNLFKSDDPNKLFKSVARSLTHQCLANPMKKSEIQSKIAKIFRRKVHIRHEDDVDLSKI